MSLGTVIQKLMAYVGGQIDVETVYYSFCTEETHQPHGSISRPTKFSLTFQGLERLPSYWDTLNREWQRKSRSEQSKVNIDAAGLDELCICGVDMNGNDVVVPFQHLNEGYGHYGYRVIAIVKHGGSEVFKPTINFDGEKRLFDYASN